MTKAVILSHFTEQIKDVFMWALAQLLRDNTGKFLIGHRCIKSHLSPFGQCKTISRRKDMRRRTQCAEEFSSAWNGLDGIPKFCFWIQNSRFTLDYSKSWNVDLEHNRDLLVYFSSICSSCRTLVSTSFNVSVFKVLFPVMWQSRVNGKASSTTLLWRFLTLTPAEVL